MDRITITPEVIILRGITTKKEFCNTEYIVYCDGNNIVIAGGQNSFIKNGNAYQVYPNYTRRIADSLENFYAVTVDKIESQAYGAWMDGAR